MTYNRFKKIKNIIQCNKCHSPLADSETSVCCNECKTSFPISNGVLIFKKSDIEKTKDAEFQVEQMFNSSITAKLTNIGSKFINSEYTLKNHLKEFLDEIAEEDIAMEIGSGNRRLNHNIINIDIAEFPNVDIIADASEIPFSDKTVDFVIIDTLLEHVPEPQKVVNEVYRILKKGGKALCITPFVFPYHGYPKHYFNFTKDGLEYLFRDFNECKIEINLGPSSALTNLLSEYFALALSGQNRFAYSLWKGFTLIPISLFKYLDKFWSSQGSGIRIASHLCTLVKKL
jgi:SAM-dependent methyltransferase